MQDTRNFEAAKKLTARIRNPVIDLCKNVTFLEVIIYKIENKEAFLIMSAVAARWLSLINHCS
jgi:hypothetical protein